jgi:hypothetical protein
VSTYGQTISKVVQFMPPSPSPSMNEALIEHVADGDLLRAGIRATMAEIRSCAERVTAASQAIHQNVTWTEVQRHCEAEKVAARAVTPVLENVDRARTRLEAEIARSRKQAGLLSKAA